MNARITEYGSRNLPPRPDMSLLGDPRGSLNIDGPVDFSPITYAINAEVVRGMRQRAARDEVAATVALARVPWALHYAAPGLRIIVSGRAEKHADAEAAHDCETDGRCCELCQTHLGCHCGDEGPYGGY